MSFRQFPATDANGDDYVIIEFKDEQADGRHLVRDGREFRTAGGELTLTT